VSQPSSMGEVVRAAQQGEKLADFYARELARVEEPLDKETRERVVATFLELIEGLYVHLPLKRAMYGKDPVQRLRLLDQRAGTVSRRAFHGELATILTELRDAHTRYVGPAGWQGKVALLPFMVELFGPTSEPRCLVSNVAKDDPAFEGTRFDKGVEVMAWNGAPIQRAIERYADRETGGRPDARLARARESLTFRPLGYGLPPDEHWVHIVYRTPEPDAKDLEIRIDWRVVDLARGEEGEEEPAPGAARRAVAVDPAAESVRRAKKLLFAPEVWYEHEWGLTTAVPIEAPEADRWIIGEFQDNVAAKRIETPSGEFGYLRLWSFDLIDDDGFLAEVQELLELLPPRGLIVDLRANPGGLIWAAERLLQLFTPHEIEPTRFSLLATDLTREMAEAPQNNVSLGPWRRSLQEAVANGEPYSRAVPLTPPSLCNNVGQRYGGPVVCVVDANTYSAGDLFAAGFVDNRVGVLISVGKATGAGGANVWTPAIVQRALAGTRYSLERLPKGIGFTLAVRRAVRSGSATGTVIEDVGVPGQIRYDLTRDDLTEGNTDLLALCGNLLASEPYTDLSVERTGDARLEVVPTGLDRVDVYVDGRPAGASLEATGDPLTAPLPTTWAEAAVLGYQGRILRQRRLVQR
jgi:C-terminal processing protease CtpA/Prc